MEEEEKKNCLKHKIFFSFLQRRGALTTTGRSILIRQDGRIAP